jgi:hypothetical protein
MLHLLDSLRCLSHLEMGIPPRLQSFRKNLMVALRSGAPEFSIGDFIWQEIKHLSEDPKRFVATVLISCI